MQSQSTYVVDDLSADIGRDEGRRLHDGADRSDSHEVSTDSSHRRCLQDCHLIGDSGSLCLQKRRRLCIIGLA